MTADNPHDRTILSGSDPEFIDELSEYLDLLASPVRLHMLSFMGSKPRTVRQIAHEIATSYENTKKHLTKLLSLGLIQKEIGVSEDPVNQGQPVFYYSLIPGCLEKVVQSLTLFTSVSGKGISPITEQVEATKKRLEEMLPGTGPSVSLVNGPASGLVSELTGEMYRIGRSEDGWDGLIPEPAILLGDEYRSVSRISRPHAWLRRREGIWTIKDGKSKGGTYLNGRPISHEPVPLKDADVIELSPGPLGATFLFRSGHT